MSGALTDTSILAGAAGAGAAYDIENSCRFDVGDTPFLYRTFGTPTNNKKWTLSLWFKRSNISQGQLFSANGNQIYFLGSDYFSYSGSTGSDTTVRMKTHQVFRDPAAWYHLVFTMDTTQAGFSDQQKLYINGERVDDMSSTAAVTQNIDTAINSAIYHSIGRYSGGGEYFDGYMADYYFIDGQVLTPASFGETDEDTNQWKAKKYTGTYGNNGFFLEFQNSAALGTDTSGNGNNFTSSGLVATAQMIDTPQNSTGGNFCTMNSLVKPQTTQTFSEGNLKIVPDNNWEFGAATFQMVSGKWYWELRAKSGSVKYGIFVDYANLSANQELGIQYYPGNKIIDATWSSYGATYGAGDIIGYACDMDGSTITFYKNGVSQGAIAFSGALTTAPAAIFGGALHGTSGGANFNFGADSSFGGEETAQNNTDDNDCGDFYYAPPSGYLALCSNNLADPAIALPGDHYNAITYTGDGATRSLTGVGFQPDWLVVKRRDANHSWMNYDVVRGFSGGVGYRLAWNNGEVESAVANGLTSFDSDGFSVGSATGVNVNTGTYAAYNWKGGGTAVSNTNGTITSSVSANPTAGFSIVGWTGTQAVGTVGHGLSAAPELIIAKDRESGAAWRVGSDDIPTAWEYVCYFSQTPGATDENTAFNDTAPTASVFTLGTGADINTSGNGIIAYCIHSVEGYSKVGKYTGNGNANGAFVWTGFRPAFFLCKNTAQTEGWNLWDSARMPYNKMPKQFMPDDNRAEYTANTTTFAIDFVSNGVKLRSSYSSLNNNAQNFVYWAFAENPFKYARAR